MQNAFPIKSPQSYDFFLKNANLFARFWWRIYYFSNIKGKTGVEAHKTEANISAEGVSKNQAGTWHLGGNYT